MLHTLWPAGLLLLPRGRLRRDLCDFAGSEADFRAVLEVKPSHRKAEQELDRASRGLQALEAARIARSVWVAHHDIFASDRQSGMLSRGLHEGLKSAGMHAPSAALWCA